MFALSIKQPWLYSILHCGKDIENRNWKPSDNMVGQQIALHSSKIFDKKFQKYYEKNKNVCICGAILGVATIKEVVQESKSKWFEGKYGIVLINVVALKEPIYCMGKLKFWQVEKEIEEKIKKELCGSRLIIKTHIFQV
jgi:hypothetical protein